MEGHHSFARENAIDGIKAVGAAFMGWLSIVSAEDLIKWLTLLYMCFLVGEKLIKFYHFLKARKAAKGDPVNPKENG